MSNDKVLNSPAYQKAMEYFNSLKKVNAQSLNKKERERWEHLQARKKYLNEKYPDIYTMPDHIAKPQQEHFAKTMENLQWEEGASMSMANLEPPKDKHDRRPAPPRSRSR